MILCNCPFFLEQKRNCIYCEALNREELNRFIEGEKAHEIKFITAQEKKVFQKKHCIHIEPFHCKRYKTLIKRYER